MAEQQDGSEFHWNHISITRQVKGERGGVKMVSLKERMDRHEDLLARWKGTGRHSRPDFDFIDDGIIDPERWERAPRRVLFMLKEAYDGPYDLRKVIRDEWQGPKYPIWYAASRLAYAIQTWTPSNQPDFPGPDLPENQEVLREALLASAVVNLKKSNGKSSSQDDDIGSFAQEDAEMLKQQVELIDPEVIVCGSVWHHVNKHVWPDAKSQGHMVWRVGNWWVIDYWHPAAPWPHRLSYYALGGILMASGITMLPLR